MSLDSRPLDADQIVDRRRLRRKLTFWRVLTVLVALAAIGAVIATSRSGSLTNLPSGAIARVTISGLIRGNQERVQALERLANSNVKAVIVHIDSPGGTTAGSEQLYDSLRRVKAKKPMVVVVDSLCASGGYIAAMASDHIIAQSASLVGSIGVLIQYPNFTDLLKTVGVKVEDVKSSPLKAAPNGFEPTSPEARAALASIVMDSYNWFKELVSSSRKLQGAALDKVADGRVFTGRQALDLKLIDQLGDERTAIEWLAKEKGIDPKTPVRDYRLRSRLSDFSFLHLAAVTTLNAVGLDGFARSLEQSGAFAAAERLNLDGLLALWHPSPTN
ncbi:signal peptide peptidase SppA [Pseudorhodoplanes sinuspersici]|uniref:Signal peptide peptidase SppA n=1 Tax=Pseudorhodoplanes sinuspersici TaxID=1235591 RepID=A0A1W6ZQL1_9HYPH|nr:signal peptide peptidase SppA [Pseudorhodoplanes sinuspersici]ARP99537.1 signal peptide peptidase SppA [Pseudorhodoplanes sinuspersici]RKE70500.1 signal peptide peptidase A [Pseudorhodoplanes sinuspersici]